MSWTKAEILTWAPIGISLAALFVAGLSMTISYRLFRRNVLSEEPLLTAALQRIDDQPGWFRLDIELQSRSNYGWAADRLRIMWPPSARLLIWEAVHTTSPDRPWEVITANPFPLAKAARKIPLGLKVTRRGVATSFDQGLRRAGDTHLATVFVFVRPSIWSRALSMRASLHSIEPIERKTEIQIIRTLPQAPKTAKA